MKTLLAQFRTTNHVLSLSLADLTDDVARRRARGGEGPSIVWTVGHLLSHRIKILGMLGDTRPNPWTERFDNSPATGGADYPTLTAMCAEWATLHAALEAACEDRAGALDQAAPGTGAHGETTIRDKVRFLAWHEGYHVGVIGALRKSAGLAGPAEVVQAASQKKK